MLRVAICDDDEKFCGEIESLILEYAEIHNEKVDVYVYYSGAALLKALKENLSLDLIFLDIEMDNVNGIEVGTSIRKELDMFLVQIVYVTSFESYAKDLFQNQPFDFITKPLEKNKVFSVIDEYKRQFDNSDIFYQFVSHKNLNKLSAREIIYVNSSGRKIFLHTKSEIFETYDKLNNFLSDPVGKQFVQIHKSFAVNYVHILGYHYDHIKVSNGEELIISRNFKKDVRQKIIDRKF